MFDYDDVKGVGVDATSKCRLFACPHVPRVIDCAAVLHGADSHVPRVIDYARSLCAAVLHGVLCCRLTRRSVLPSYTGLCAAVLHGVLCCRLTRGSVLPSYTGLTNTSFHKKLGARETWYL